MEVVVVARVSLTNLSFNVCGWVVGYLLLDCYSTRPHKNFTPNLNESQKLEWLFSYFQAVVHARAKESTFALFA